MYPFDNLAPRSGSLPQPLTASPDKQVAIGSLIKTVCTVDEFTETLQIDSFAAALPQHVVHGDHKYGPAFLEMAGAQVQGRRQAMLSHDWDELRRGRMPTIIEGDHDRQATSNRPTIHRVDCSVQGNNVEACVLQPVHPAFECIARNEQQRV